MNAALVFGPVVVLVGFPWWIAGALGMRVFVALVWLALIRSRLLLLLNTASTQSTGLKTDTHSKVV